MGLFWRLLLAHLLADYPLQPNALVARKGRAAGLVLHIAIHLLVSMLLVWPVLGRIWPALLFVALFHALLDRSKISLARRAGLAEGRAYLLDQALHVGSLACVAWYGGLATGSAVLPVARWSVQAVVLVLCTFVWAVTERVLQLGTPDYREEAREQYWPRLVARGLPVLVAIAAAPGGAAAAALLLPYVGRRCWRRALLTDLLVSGLGVLALAQM